MAVAHVGVRRLAVSILLAVAGSAQTTWADTSKTGFAPLDAQTLAATVTLLPARPLDVAVVDATAARPEVRDRLLTLDAFVLRGQPGIYLVKQSHLVQRARAGSRLHLLILASVVWHEMAHVRGADEADAKRAEEQLWTQFMRDGRVDHVTGLRYLAALKKRQ